MIVSDSLYIRGANVGIRDKKQQGNSCLLLFPAVAFIENEELNNKKRNE